MPGRSGEHRHRPYPTATLEARALLAEHATSGDRTALPEATGSWIVGWPEGHVRIFVDGRPPLAALLQVCARQGAAPGHVRRLVSAGVPAGG